MDCGQCSKWGQWGLRRKPGQSLPLWDMVAAWADARPFDNSAVLTVEPLTIANPSFETPAITNYRYFPGQAGWEFSGNAGILRNDSDFGAANAPHGVQAAFLQGKSDGRGMAQTRVRFPVTSKYKLSFRAARRDNQVQPIKVTLDGAQIGPLITPSGRQYSAHEITFTAGASIHRIGFEATDSPGDRTSFIDRVAVTPIDPPPAPRLEGSRVGNGLVVSFQSVAGVNYRLQRSQTLPPGWRQTKPGAPLNGNGAVLSHAIPLAPGPQGFYRVVCAW